MENRFNLIEEKWIPVTERGRVSLMDVFSDDSISGLSGNPVEKIALFKLLLAIAQSAVTPKDEEEWENLGTEGMKEKVLSYLEKHKDCFWLYGEKPFLQMPQIKEAGIQSWGAVQMEIATGNTSVVTEIQKEKELSDAERAVILVLLMGFACGGKKTDNSVVLSKGYTLKSNDKGKPSSGRFGSSLGFMGLNHSFFLEDTLITSIYVNVLSEEKIKEINMFPAGVGIAPWEKMPNGEDDEIARNLKSAYMGRLVPVNRFVLFAENGLHYTEGIFHAGYDSFIVDPSVSVDFLAKPKPKVLWVSPEKKPWRQLPALLAFLDSSSKEKFECFQLKVVLERLKKYSSFKIWSGGVKVSSNAGEQYLTGTDDYVESEVEFSSDFFMDTENFYGNLNLAMEYMDNLSKNLFGRINGYYTALMMNGSSHASNATSDYWQLCEGQFQKVIDACSDSSGARLKSMHKIFNGFVYQLYDQYCPKDTARQLEAWAENKPRIKKDKEE